VHNGDFALAAKPPLVALPFYGTFNSAIIGGGYGNSIVLRPVFFGMIDPYIRPKIEYSAKIQ